MLYTKDELVGDLVIGYPAYEANYPAVYDFQVYVLRAPGVSAADARAAVTQAAEEYPNANIKTSPSTRLARRPR